MLVPIIVLAGEIPEIINYEDLSITSSFWPLMTAGGVCGFAIGFFTSLQIKVRIIMLLFFF